MTFTHVAGGAGRFCWVLSEHSLVPSAGSCTVLPGRWHCFSATWQPAASGRLRAKQLTAGFAGGASFVWALVPGAPGEPAGNSPHSAVLWAALCCSSTGCLPERAKTVDLVMSSHHCVALSAQRRLLPAGLPAAPQRTTPSKACKAAALQHQATSVWTPVPGPPEGSCWTYCWAYSNDRLHTQRACQKPSFVVNSVTQKGFHCQGRRCVLLAGLSAVLGCSSSLPAALCKQQQHDSHAFPVCGWLCQVHQRGCSLLLLCEMQCPSPSQHLYCILWGSWIDVVKAGLHSPLLLLPCRWQHPTPHW